MSEHVHTVACHECDLLVRIPRVPPGGGARCPRCNCQLARGIRNSLERTSALALAGLVLFITANTLPFLTLEVQGTLIQTTIMGGAKTLYEQGSEGVAGLVTLTAVFAPLLHIGLVLYVVFPLMLGRRPALGLSAMRLLHAIRPWSMAEVFMIGVLVSMVKLADLASIVPGFALWSFAAMIPVLAGSMVTLDTELVWHELAPGLD